MKVNKRLALILKSLVGLLVTLLLIIGLLEYIDITFTSEKARRVLLEQIKTLTQRDVRIDDEVQITVSLFPQLRVERVHIKNLEGFGDEDFLAISDAKIQLALLPLLTGSFHLEVIAANHVTISLIQKKEGKYNWSFDHLIRTPETISKETEAVTKKKATIGRLTLGVFNLTDISIKYTDASYDMIIDTHLDQLLINLNNRSKPQAEITGSFQSYPYNITLEADELNKLTTGQAWTLYGSGDIADRKTTINASVQLKEDGIYGNTDVNVKKIDLGMLLEEFGISEGRHASADEAVITTEFRGSSLTEIYQQAEISLQLLKGNWILSSTNNDKPKEFVFNNVSLRTSWNKPVIFHLDGMLAGEILKIDFNTNRLVEFFDEIQTLDVDLKADVAGSNITAKGTMDLPIKTNRFQLKISLEGKDLEKLNKILDSELPPFNNYSLTGYISANEKGFIVKADDATIGDTHFNTVIVIDTSSIKPFWTINLNSPQLQIKDFEFAEAKTEKPAAETIKAALKKTGGESKQEPGYRLKQIVDDPKMHFDLNLKVEKVLAGESVLGGSSLKMKLRDGTLIIQDAELDLPRGKIISTVSFKVNNEQVTGALKLDIDKFESGVVARYFTQGSSDGGVISARVDLQLGGKNFTRLFDHASGKMDVALWPGNVRTKIFDVWANNLFLLILPEIRKKESRVNCVVALMDLEDGIMKEDFFGIDTTKVWMHGNINVDFANEYLVLSLYPRSKTARMFAVQAPIRVQGKFDDIGLITNPVDITAAYVSFITSPLHVPARRVFGDNVPDDASEICEQFYDREYVKKLKEKLQAEEQKEIDEWLDSD